MVVIECRREKSKPRCLKILKVKVTDFLREEENDRLMLLRTTVRTNLLSMKLWKKEMCAAFATAPQTAQGRATVHGKSLIKMAKVLNVCKMILWKKETTSAFIKVYCYNCSTLLLLLFDLLLCLIYAFFVIGMHGRNIPYIKFGTICDLRHPMDVLLDICHG